VRFIYAGEDEENNEYSCKPSNTASAFRRLCVAFENFRRHQSCVYLFRTKTSRFSSSRSQETVSKKEDSHRGRRLAFQVFLEEDRAQERGRLGGRRLWFSTPAATEAEVSMAYLGSRLRVSFMRRSPRCFVRSRERVRLVILSIYFFFWTHIITWSVFFESKSQPCLEEPAFWTKLKEVDD